MYWLQVEQSQERSTGLGSNLNLVRPMSMYSDFDSRLYSWPQRASLVGATQSNMSAPAFMASIASLGRTPTPMA